VNPSALIPAPDALPVPWGWFQALLTVTFVIHLLFMNALLGGVLIAFVGSCRRGAGLAVAREISTRLPFAVAFTVNAGIAPLLFLQVLYGQFVYSSSILMARWWFAIIWLLIVAYYAIYAYRDGFERGAAARQALLGLAAGILLLVSFLFTSNWTLAVAPERWPVYFAHPDGTWLNVDAPTLWPRWLHMVVGSLAVAGLTLAGFAARRAGRGDRDAAARVREGLRWFTWATLAQVVPGVWWLLALRPEVRRLFMGGSALASATLVLGLLLTATAVYFGFRGRLRPAIVTTGVLVPLMAVQREIVRAGDLAPWFRPSDLAVHREISPLILFLAVFAVGALTVAHMLRLAARAGKEA